MANTYKLVFFPSDQQQPILNTLYLTKSPQPHMKSLCVLYLVLVSGAYCSTFLTDSNSTGQALLSCTVEIYNGTLRNGFYLETADQIIIKVISPISLLSSCLVILFYVKFPGTRQQPGDIILAIAVSQIFLNIGYLCTAFYNDYVPIDFGNFVLVPGVNPPPGFDQFCIVTGYMIVLSFCAEFIYNVCFCIFFIVTVKNVLKSWHKEKCVVHVVCLIGTAITGMVFYVLKQVGVSLFGVCGLKVSNYSPFFRSMLILVYFAVLIVSTFYFKKHVPKFDSNSEKRRMFLNYYYRYIISVSINLILQTTCDLVAAIDCQTKPSNYMRFFITLSNTFSILTPVIICPVMFTHPEVRNGAHEFFVNWMGSSKNRKKRLTQSTDENQLVQMQRTGGLLYNIMEITKTRLIYSILCALVIEDRQITGLPNLRQVNEWNYSDKMSIKMKDMVLAEFPDITVETMKLLDVQITSYCPRVFKTLMRSDGFVSIAASLNPKSNEDNIKKSSQGDGGRSGQFFFFSFDNQIIIKTLTKNQLDVLLGRLQPMAEHFEAHPNSLITKIYGAYTLNSQETGEQYHLFVMRNLSGCDRKFITKTYDLKGSRLDRKVLKQYSLVGEKVDKVMKDIDFENIEGRLFIASEQTETLKQILIEDSRFLKQNQLIDYSLIVMKMNLNSYLLQKQMLPQQFRSRQTNPYSIIPSTKETGVAYVLGIIDFLETWTAKKKSQRLTKILLLFKFQSSDDVSAQAPELYSQRFIRQVVDMII